MVEISVIMQSLGEVSDDNQLTNQLFLRDFDKQTSVALFMLMVMDHGLLPSDPNLPKQLAMGPHECTCWFGFFIGVRFIQTYKIRRYTPQK